MQSWTDRIKAQMKETGLTQEEVAEKMGITRGAITHYLAGRRIPPLKQFQKLASVLKVDPAWLQFGINPDAATLKRMEKEEKQAIKYYPIPVLTWDQAYQGVDASRIKSRNSQECIDNIFTDNPRWFALRAKGDSMTSFNGRKSIHDGDIVIVDPDIKPVHGDFVIAVMSKANEATLKQYVIDAGIKYLKPLNIQYPITQFEKGMAIVGVVKKIVIN